MAKTKAAQRATTYALLKAEAVMLLGLASTYADDGAPLMALVKAKSAIDVLKRAMAARDAIMGGTKKGRR